VNDPLPPRSGGLGFSIDGEGAGARPSTDASARWDRYDSPAPKRRSLYRYEARTDGPPERWLDPAAARLEAYLAQSTDVHDAKLGCANSNAIRYPLLNRPRARPATLRPAPEPTDR
jgi:hypothetical protein